MNNNNPVSVVTLANGITRKVEDLTSCDKQEIATRLVEREIFHCASQMISGIVPHMYEMGLEDELMSVCRPCNDISEEDYQEAAEAEGWIKFEDATEEQRKEALEEYLPDNNTTDQTYIQIDDDGSYLDSDYRIDSYEELCRDHNIEVEGQEVEVFEFWIISDWLAYRLPSETILGFNIWGRTCTGQAICLDSDIQEIAIECYSRALQEGERTE